MAEVVDCRHGGHAPTHPLHATSYEARKYFIFSSTLVLNSLKDTRWGDLLNFMVDSIFEAWEFTGLKVAFMVGVKMTWKQVLGQWCVFVSQDNLFGG